MSAADVFAPAGRRPALSQPPGDIGPLIGWRDPYIFEGPSEANGGIYRLLIGSGLQGIGGTALVYRTHHPLASWDYEGMLCLGNLSEERKSGACFADLLR